MSFTFLPVDGTQPGAYTAAMRGDTIIILPAFNEAEGIGAVIAGARRHVPDATIVVVDDGSTDDTRARALASGARVLSLSFNMGYGVALQTGYKYAFSEGFGYLVQIDADGQHDPSDIPALLGIVRSGDYDLCLGSRFLIGETYRIPLFRRLGMMVLRRVASALVGHTVTDPTSGFQAMNRRVMEFFSRDAYPVDYPDTDVLVMLHHHGFRVREAPTVMRPSPTGKTIHAGVRPLYYLFKMALNIPLNILRREK
jgi:glycosyltransferase involved in cell wall biosynthesis